MTETQKLEAIQDMGREAATSLMNSAVEQAQNPDQADNHLLATYWAGIHLVAHHVFNQIKIAGANKEGMIRAVLADIEDEFNELLESEKNGEMEIKKFPGGEEH